ncbi:hypothetical protein RB593_004057 [Gaeumannomyces tritici]
MATTKAAPVVWINGFPGCGKLTVATAIRALDETVIVLDNHKLIDPVEERVARTHPSYRHERRCFRQAVLKENVCDPAGLSRLVVFTDFQSDNELGRAVASEYKDAAISAASPASRAGRPSSLIVAPWRIYVRDPSICPGGCFRRGRHWLKG